MQRTSRPEGLELPPSQMQHSLSLSSERTSMSASPSLASPPSVAPDPMYIAASTASQIITNDHQSQIDDWFDEHGGRVDAETAVISPASLILVNSFLDQLLFSILACARSTSILSLRPAVTEVLKPRLAKDAIDGADDELHEFLGGGDDEELSAFHNGQESRGKWDLNLVWRRTRLRCMVYTRLGDMEQEDEEMYIERERMEDANEDHRRLSRELGIISPAAAIFLTSILEFIGEHALMIAGEAAFNRREIRQLRHDHGSAGNPNGTERVVVEDIDIEKLAFNATLGRLWRSWKKRVRTPSVSYSRPLSRDLARRRVASSSASPSVSEVDESNQSNHDVPRPSVGEVLQEEHEPNAAAASSVNSPINARGLVIGLAETTSDETSMVKERSDNRPRSMMVYPHPFVFLPLANLPGSNSSNEGTHAYPGLAPARSRWHQRSASLPSPGLSPYISQHETFFTPMESPELILAPQDDRSDIPEDGSLREKDTSTVPGDDAGSEVSTAHRDVESHSNSETPAKGMSPAKSHETSPADAPVEGRSISPESLRNASSPIPAGHDAESEESSPDATKKTQHAALDFKTGPNTITDAVQNGNDSSVAYHSPAISGGVIKTPAERETQDARDDVRPMSSATMRGQKIRADDEIRPQNESLRLGKRSAPVKSIPRSDPDAGDSTRPPKDQSSSDIHLTPAKVTSLAPSLEHGAPPLTPLRELMEAAHDTSDDSSSLTPSHDATKSDPLVLTEASHNHGSSSPESRTSSNISPTKRSSRGNQTYDSRKDLTSVNATGNDRAAVQRISPSPVLAREPLGPLARTSTSSNRPHTSASGTSQLSHKIKTLIGRESNEGNRQPALRRTSSVESGTTSDTQSEKTPEAVDTQRSFEELIKSDQTIQYTLTPKNMRDMEKTDPSRAKTSQPGTGESADQHLNGDSADVESDRSTAGRTTVTLKSLNGLRSNPPVGSKGPGSSSSRSPSSQTEKGQLQTSSTSSIGRSSPIIPRDARAKMETTSDFADFIRTTGPEREPETSLTDAHLVPGIVTRPDNPITSTSRMSSTPEQSSSLKIGKSNSLVGSTVPGTSKRAISKLQARDPTVSYGDQSSDLIDFIRQGPAHDRGDGSHRIPRNVAPFRTTMDSDEIQALGNGKGKEALDATSSIASTQDSLAPVKSVHSSSNSRTALIDTTTRSKVRNVSAPVALNPPRPDEPPHPVRKQRRAKDPFPIDVDTDEDDGLTTTPKPQHQEENLIDFLRSVAPPPPRPIIPSAFDGVQKPTRNTLQKKASGPSMRDRFAQNSSPPSSSKTPMARPMQQPGSGSYSVRRKNEAPQIPPLSARAASPHLITQVGTKLDSYMPTRPTYAAHIDRERNGARRTYQARPEREPDSGLSELADFFRNSGPPTPPLAQTSPAKTPSVIRVAKEESGFSKIFSRKKKSAGRA